MKITKGQVKKKLLGLTNKELAHMVDISESYLVNILSGKIKPSQETLQKIADALKLKVDEVQEPVSNKLLEDLSNKLEENHKEA
jgi:transcriptional regulator with XRE-family HTH domain